VKYYGKGSSPHFSEEIQLVPEKYIDSDGQHMYAGVNYRRMGVELFVLRHFVTF
jgi:hypothetical protein